MTPHTLKYHSVDDLVIELFNHLILEDVEKLYALLMHRLSKPQVARVGNTIETLTGALQYIVMRSNKHAELAGFDWAKSREGICEVAEKTLMFVKEESLKKVDKSVDPRIVTPCPACHRATLFIGSGGHLTCSSLQRRCPSPEEVNAKQVDELHRLRLAAALLRVFLESRNLSKEWYDFLSTMGIVGA